MTKDIQDSEHAENDGWDQIELPDLLFRDVLQAIANLFQTNKPFSTKTLFKDCSSALQIDKRAFELLFKTFQGLPPKQQSAVFAEAGLVLRQVDKGWWEISDFERNPTNAPQENKDQLSAFQALSELERILLDLIPEDGSTIGNYTLIDQFQAAVQAKTGKNTVEDDYWETRNRLIAEGLINKGRGKGGSVYRSADTADTDEQSSPHVAVVEDSEEEPGNRDFAERRLYEPFKTYLNFWANDNDLQDHIIYQTSDGGGKKTGGKWTRPDFVVFSRRVFEFVHGAFFELITFEIKPQGGDRIESVFETAAHARFSNRSFLALHQPLGRPDKAEFRRIEDECRRLGLGLIIFTAPENPESYEILVDAEYRVPDPEHMNQFIDAQMEKEHYRIRRMLRCGI